MLENIPWLIIILSFVFIYLAVSLYLFHRNPSNNYNLWDMLMFDGKADLYKHVVVAMTILTCWVVVWLTLQDKSVETLLLGALGIFIGGRLVNSVTDKIVNKKE
jgi:hypothetical protein